MEHNEETLNGLKEHMGDNDMVFIDAKDTFDFQCQQCGRCCMHRTDIILNPFDVYNGARYLGITPEEFLQKYTIFSLGGTSRIPMVMLACDDRGWCPLLTFDIKDGGKYKCTINPAKPGACANHPIGTVREYNKTTGEESVHYVKVSSCANSQGHNELHVVEDWCKNYLAHIDEIKVAHELQTCVEDFFPCRLLDFLMFVIGRAQEEHDLPEQFKDLEPALNSMRQIYNAFQDKYIGVLYANYDTSKPFIEQAKKNKDELVEHIFTPMRKMLVMFCKDMPEVLKEMLKIKVGVACEKFFDEIKDEDVKIDTALESKEEENND